VLTLCDRYHEGSIDFRQGYVYVALLDNFSVSLSLYYLVLFYMATNNALAPHKPLAKFLCVKCVVFFTWWQGLFLSVFCWLGILRGSGTEGEEYGCGELSTYIQNVLIQFEMLFLAIVHIRVFSAAVYKFGPNRPSTQQPLAGLMPIDPRSLRDDLREIAPSALPGLGGHQQQGGEQRIYVPPAADHSPLQQDVKVGGVLSQVELPPSHAVPWAEAPSAVAARAASAADSPTRIRPEALQVVAH